MSARKIGSAGALQQITVEAREARLELVPEAIRIHKTGIEFCSDRPFSLWTEMTLALECPQGGGKVHCHGVVISCVGNRHTGYQVTMLFTDLSKQSQERLNTLAYS
jgi:hypothetical protein